MVLILTLVGKTSVTLVFGYTVRRQDHYTELSLVPQILSPGGPDLEREESIPRLLQRQAPTPVPSSRTA